jgi:phage terminase large subunit
VLISDKDIDFPEWADFLFKPYRYKVAHGGRGSGKSWAFARALIFAAASQPLRILCAREIQKSIKESVHRLLSDQIEDMGMGHLFEILETEIRGRNGSLFFFAGLQSHTVTSIKSFEGCDICFVEEAQTVCKKSWDILIPTIRKPDSEIWVAMNPVLDTDETWQRLVVNRPPNSLVKQVNWSDNPWFPDVLNDEREHAKATMAKDDYENIWEGLCRSAVEGAIYSGEVQAAIREERVRPVPYDPRLKVHTIWDMGWADSMTIIMVQKGLAELRIIGYIEESQKTLDWYAGELNKLNYNWGYDYLPHDGFHGDYKTGKSAAELLKRFKRRVKATPKLTVEQGIRAARMAFPRCYFDKTKTARLVECLKRYRRALNKTDEAMAPVHDEYSHGADAFRYLGVVADLLTNEESGLSAPDYQFVSADSSMGY